MAKPKPGWFYILDNWRWHFFKRGHSLCGDFTVSPKTALQPDVPMKDHEQRCPICLKNKG